MTVPRNYEWADTIQVSSVDALGRAIHDRRHALGITQKQLGAATGVEAEKISRLEMRALEPGDDEEDLEFGVAIRLVEALELDLELRPRGSQFTPRPPTKLNELGLNPRTMSALKDAGIESIDQLGSPTVMLALPQFSDGTALHEVVCALSRYGLSLQRRHAPGNREREIFRRRVIDGLTLRELAAEFGVHTERIRQLLNAYFGLTGTPPAATKRQQRRKDTAPGRRP
jgi:transcriptional regulator with XRE-family HTH domain